MFGHVPTLLLAATVVAPCMAQAPGAQSQDLPLLARYAVSRALGAQDPHFHATATSFGSSLRQPAQDLVADFDGVGASPPSRAPPPGGSRGSAYVFVRPVGGWVTATETGKLTASDGVAGASFGRVTVSGHRIAVGAPSDDDNGADSGSIYLFEKPPGGWGTMTESQKLSTGTAGDGFGIRVDFSGPTLVVGADGDDTLAANAGAAYVFVAPDSPRGAALLDVDADGDLDVVTADSGSDAMSIRTNDGAGVLATATRVPLDKDDRAPVAVAACDSDNDRVTDDLALACGTSDTVAILRNAGGIWVASSHATGGAQPASIVAGDLNGADRDDMVVGRIGRPFVGGAGLALRIDNGAFAELAIPGGYADKVVAMALCDLDGDGDNDLAALAQGGPDQILLYAGDGVGGLVFADAITLPTSGLAKGLCCRDLDGDLEPDLAVLLPVLFPTPATDLRVYVYSGSGTLTAGDYAAGTDITTGGQFGVALACGEFDDDSIPGFLTLRDLAIVHAGSSDVLGGYGLDTGSWTFGSTAALSFGTSPIAVAVGDLDADGADDVVVVNQGSDDVTVNLGVAAALAQQFGTGCAGASGVPVLSGTGGAPTLGNPAFGTALTNALPFGVTMAMLSVGQSTAALTGGCSIYLAPPIASFIRFTNAAGGDQFVFGIPNLPSLLGADVFFQTAVFDPAGAFAGLLSLTNGLRVQVGS